MPGFMGWLAWILAPGCMGPYPFPIEDPTVGTVPQARCDGVLQEAEGDTVDSLFDRDEDGFVGASEPGCAEVYAAQLLDCDDQAPLVHPGAGEVLCNADDDDCDASTPDEEDSDEDGYTCDDCDDENAARHPDHAELCGDDLDNDCDGEDAGECLDYGGTFTLDHTVSYQCALGLVNVTLFELELEWLPPDARATNLSGQKPDVLSGEVDSDGSFVLEKEFPGACAELYRLSGEFIDENTFTATFETQFLGSCFDCSNQSFPDLVGTRVGTE